MTLVVALDQSTLAAVARGKEQALRCGLRFSVLLPPAFHLPAQALNLPASQVKLGAISDS